MDEQEKIDRRAHVRLIVTEVLMFLAVLALVGFLTLVVMGYSFNLRGLSGGGEVVERSGLVQISSVPTGATIYIDGEAPLLLSTNASRTMLAGEHEISLERDGFLGWKKTIRVTEGMVYRLNYPRLIKTERETEEVFEFEKAEVELLKVPEKYVMGEGAIKSEGVKLVSVSPNHELMVVLMGSSLYITNLNENKPELKLVELVDAEGKAVAIKTMQKVAWSGNSERMLALVNEKWVVVNVKNAKETVWLGEILAERSAFEKRDEITVKDVKFESEAGERLLILSEKKALFEVNVRDKKVSEALMTEVASFDNDGERVVFLSEEGKLMAYRVGEEEGHLITEAAKGAKFATERYFQESYVGVVENGKFVVYRKTGWPMADEEMEEVFSEEVGFEVSAVKKRGKGMVFELVGTEGEDKVFDIEAMTLTPVDATNTAWVDEYLRYKLKDGKLSVVDYDGLNERELVSTGVRSGRTVTISGNNRWLYYFVSADKEGVEKLVRERVL